MPIWVELRDAESTPMRDTPDPSGGTFDGAGDFDRYLGRPILPVLGSVDPYADTSMVRTEMPGLLRDIETALISAHEGPESRGLRRLWALAQRCQADLSTHLLFVGD